METLEINVVQTIHSYCYVSYQDMGNVLHVILESLIKNPEIKKIVLNFSEIEHCYVSYIDDLIAEIYKKIDKKIDQFEIKNLDVNSHDLCDRAKDYNIQQRNDEIYQHEQEYRKYEAEMEAKRQENLKKKNN